MFVDIWGEWIICVCVGAVAERVVAGRVAAAVALRVAAAARRRRRPAAVPTLAAP